MTDLAAFLRAGAARPFSWAECNCAFWPCDWIALWHADPAAALRGRHRDARGFGRAIRRAGGFLALVDMSMAEVGLPRTDAPLPGDVGIVRGRHRPTMALKTATGWAGKSAQGLILGRFPMVAAWSVPCPR